MTEMIQTLEDIITIKKFENYKSPITLEELKKRLFLVKNKKEARYKAERLDLMNFFFKTDPGSTAWDKLAKDCGAS